MKHFIQALNIVLRFFNVKYPLYTVCLKVNSFGHTAAAQRDYSLYLLHNIKIIERRTRVLNTRRFPGFQADFSVGTYNTETFLSPPDTFWHMTPFPQPTRLLPNRTRPNTHSALTTALYSLYVPWYPRVPASQPRLRYT